MEIAQKNIRRFFNYYKVPALSHCALPSKIAIPHHRKATPTAKPEHQPKMYILHFSACYNFALSYADMRPSVPVYIVALYDIALPAEINMV